MVFYGTTFESALGIGQRRHWVHKLRWDTYRRSCCMRVLLVAVQIKIRHRERATNTVDMHFGAHGPGNRPAWHCMAAATHKNAAQNKAAKAACAGSHKFSVLMFT